MSIGGVLSEAWELYKKFLGRFFMTAFVVFVILDLLSGLADQASGDGWVSVLVWTVIAATIGVVGYFLVQAALVETVNDVRDGRADRSIGETFRAVQPRLPSVIGAGLVAAIAIGIGFLLLIVPGLYLLTIWSMLIPVIVLEGVRAGDAFGRSQEIVRGNGWRVFGLAIVTFLIVGIAEGIIRAIFSPLPDFLATWIGSLVAHSLTVPFAAAALTTAYFHLVRGAAAEAATPLPSD